jgi:hypothetical protein
MPSLKNHKHIITNKACEICQFFNQALEEYNILLESHPWNQISVLSANTT